MSDKTEININEVNQDVHVTVTIEDPVVDINVSQIGEKGDKGDPGEKGDQGDPGPVGDFGSYKHEQPIASSQWNIDHGLGFKPGGIIVQDSAGESWVPGEIIYTDLNSLILKFFAGSFSGTAYLS